MLANRPGLSGRQQLIGGLIALVVGIVVIVARFNNPTPAVVSVAVVGIVTGFTLAISGGLALFSRPVWIEGRILDARWTIVGVRRVGVVLLETAEEHPLTLHLDAPVFRHVHTGDRVRIEHNNLNRAQVYRVEVVEHAPPTT